MRDLASENTFNKLIIKNVSATSFGDADDGDVPG